MGSCRVTVPKQYSSQPWWQCCRACSCRAAGRRNSPCSGHEGESAGASAGISLGCCLLRVGFCSAGIHDVSDGLQHGLEVVLFTPPAHKQIECVVHILALRLTRPWRVVAEM